MEIVKLIIKLFKIILGIFRLTNYKVKHVCAKLFAVWGFGDLSNWAMQRNSTIAEQGDNLGYDLGRAGFLKQQEHTRSRSAAAVTPVFSL